MTANVWEPWTPAVGQRVRVRLSGECRTPQRGESPAGGITSSKSHYPEEDGRLGVVVPCPYIEQEGSCTQAETTGHRFVVKYAEMLLRDDLWASGGHYAAIELEPVE